MFGCTHEDQHSNISNVDLSLFLPIEINDTRAYMFSYSAEAPNAFKIKFSDIGKGVAG